MLTKIVFAGRTQVNASCRLHHWLGGHRDAQLNRAAGQTDSRIMMTSLFSEIKRHKFHVQKDC